MPSGGKKAREKRRRREYETVFVNGKQKRIKRAPTIDGMSVDELIRRNADPIWFLQHEMYEDLHQLELDAEEWLPEAERPPGKGDR